MEKSCGNCQKHVIETDIDENVYIVCGEGYETYMVCQCACIEDHFEPIV